MLPEVASSREDRPIIRTAQPPISQAEMLHNDIRQMVANVLLIEDEDFVEPPSDDEPAPAEPELGFATRLVAMFEGKLTRDSESAYEELDRQLEGIDHLAVFRETASLPEAEVGESNPHTIMVFKGRLHPQPRPWWPNLLLFIVTVFSVLMVGASMAIAEIGETNRQQAEQMANNILGELWRGWPYAAAILLILGAHELGHYFAARRHKLAVTLPYFIPIPFLNLTLIGTMGAFIQLRQPMRNRKVLFDVGAAGPLTGLIFAIPILLIGLAVARLAPIEPNTAYIYEGDSLFYALAKTIAFGRFVPDGQFDVMITSSQLAWAGWTGLLVTALNLIPIGQLDGGHILYALIGERARWLYYPLLLVLGGLALMSGMWLIWVLILLFFGRIYATPLDMITPLDPRRRSLALLTLFIFAMIFVPAPLTQITTPGTLEGPRQSVYLLPMLVLPALGWLRARFRG